jgi:ferredoxin
VEVSVIADLCQGHARCWQACPEVFSLDNEGHAFVADGQVPVGLERRAQEAADNCPERAISVS